jgi:hypothetical protein
MTNAARRPLVIIDGQVSQLPAGDTLDAVSSEVDVIPLTNGAGTTQPICTPFYISAANTGLPARANASGTAGAIGLLRADVSAGQGGFAQTDGLLTATTSQWDAVTGQTGGLTPGTVYFLSSSTAGRITSTAPIAQGEFVVRMGRAISTTALEISIEPPIGL